MFLIYREKKVEEFSDLSWKESGKMFLFIMKRKWKNFFIYHEKKVEEFSGLSWKKWKNFPIFHEKKVEEFSDLSWKENRRIFRFIMKRNWNSLLIYHKKKVEGFSDLSWKESGRIFSTTAWNYYEFSYLSLFIVCAIIPTFGALHECIYWNLSRM